MRKWKETREKMGREYDAYTLKAVQEIELEMLECFLEICEKHDLTYFAFAGTGIGALRHGGFIPWDDDIDINMPRKDFEKFVEIAKRDYGDRYYFLNATTDEHYPLMTTRWCKKGTVFWEESLKGVPCKFGIFLDLYPMDEVSDDPKKLRRQAMPAWFWSKIMILREVPYPVLPFQGMTKKVIHGICACVHVLLKTFHVSHNWLYGRCMAACTKYNGVGTDTLGYLCSSQPYEDVLKKSQAYPLKKLKFEHLELNFPNKIEEMLTATYGDYMKLPPAEKRKNHFPYRLELGDYTPGRKAENE